MFRKYTSKAFSAIILVALVLISTAGLAHAANLNDLQNQLNKAQSDLSYYQTQQQSSKQQSQQYQQNISNLENQIYSVQSSIDSLQSQINSKQNDIDATVQNINAKTAQLNQLTSQLNSSLAIYYEMTNLNDMAVISPASNLSTLSDRTEFLSSLQNQLLTIMNQVTSAKQDLQNTQQKLQQQQSDLATMKGQQEAKKSGLSSQQQQVTSLLSQSNKKTAQYQSYINQLSSQQQKLNQQIYALRLQLGLIGKEGITDGATGYPYAGAGYWYTDPWGFYKGECTSYAAWKWNSMGHHFYDVTPGNGNAYQWPSLAQAQGYSTSFTPAAGDIVSWARSSAMPYGHVAYVESVNANGTINVSEANWATPHGTDYRSNIAYSQYGRATFIAP